MKCFMTREVTLAGKSNSLFVHALRMSQHRVIGYVKCTMFIKDSGGLYSKLIREKMSLMDCMKSTLDSCPCIIAAHFTGCQLFAELSGTQMLTEFHR